VLVGDARRRLACPVGLVVALARRSYSVGYGRHVSTDDSIWDLVARDEGMVLRTLRQQLPHPVPPPYASPGLRHVPQPSGRRGSR
jgi:hypothetical protein